MSLSDRTAEIAATSTVRQWCRNGRARQLREVAGLTLAEVAELAGTDRQTVYRWERGESAPRGDNALRYYRALVQLQEITAAANESAASLRVPRSPSTTSATDRPPSTSRPRPRRSGSPGPTGSSWRSGASSRAGSSRWATGCGSSPRRCWRCSTTSGRRDEPPDTTQRPTPRPGSGRHRRTTSRPPRYDRARP
jgi:DNA-binding XRE family transcriptional regulator